MHRGRIRILCFRGLDKDARLERFDFAETAQMTRGPGKLRAQKRFDEFLSQFFSYDARADDQNIEVVVFHALPRGAGVVANAGADAGNLVGGHSHAHAAAVEEDAAVGLAFGYGVRDEFGEVRVVRGIFVEGADVENVMAERAYHVAHFAFERETRVVGTDDDAHESLTFRCRTWRWQ